MKDRGLLVMPVLPLEKRDGEYKALFPQIMNEANRNVLDCWGYYCSSSSWVWGRWILFVLFIVAILCVVLAAIRINKRRGQEGREPIRGTAWITPPSYVQSQHQSNTQQPFVPPYSEQANDNDAGYYDNQGVFHPNLKAQEAANNNTMQRDYTGQPQHLSTLVPDSTGLSSPPPQAYQPTGQTQGTGDDHELNFQRDFSRYYNNPNTGGTNGVGSSSSNPTSPRVDDVELENFSRPEGPPPAHLRGKN